MSGSDNILDAVVPYINAQILRPIKTQAQSYINDLSKWIESHTPTP